MYLMSGKPDLNSIVQPSKNKYQQVYEQLREAILNNEFPPGTVMVERKLCELYHVSRSPVRNAIHQLTFEGLLSNQPGKGAVVPEFTLEDILDIYDLLEVLQVYAARMCIHRMDAIGQAEMERIMANMRKAIEQGDVRQSSQWDQRLHEFIVVRANNRRLQGFFEQLQNNQARLIAQTMNDMPLYERAYEEHQEICTCIIARDVEGAGEAIKCHYKNLRKYYIDLLIYHGQHP